MFLEISQSSQENTSARVFFFNKAAEHLRWLLLFVLNVHEKKNTGLRIDQAKKYTNTKKTFLHPTLKSKTFNQF